MARNRQLEAIGNVVNRLFEKAGAVVLPADGKFPVHLEMYDGGVRLYYSNPGWYCVTPGKFEPIGTNWADACLKVCYACVDLNVERLVVDEEMEMMFEEEACG